MSPKFQVYKDSAKRTRFRLRADNNKIVAVGEAYKHHAGCISGIKSVQKNSGAPIQDLTVGSGPKLPNPKYQIYKDAKGKFRFSLKAGNGEIIAQGEGYESKEGCLNGIEVVKNSANATIEDPLSINKFEPQTQTASKTEEMLAPPPQAVPKPEVAQPGEEREDLTPVAPILSAKKEVIVDHGSIESSLELDSAPENIAKGDKVTLRGRLLRINTNEGISGAKICILERDKSILGDDYLAFGYTAEDGSFNICWKARRLSWRKDTGEIFAKFAGNAKAKPSKSTVQTISIK